MSFKITGIDELKKQLNDMVDGAQPSTLNNWADKILRTAQSKCNDHMGKRIKMKKKSMTRFEVEFSSIDIEGWDCLIKSIEYHLNSMPEITRKHFEIYLKEFKSRRKQFT